MVSPRGTHPSSSEFYTDLCVPRASQVPGQPAWQTVAQRIFDGPGKLGNRVSACFGRIRVQAFPLSPTITIGPHIFFDIIMFS